MTNDFNFELDASEFADISIDLADAFHSRYIKPPRTQEIAEQNLKYANAEKLAADIQIGPNDRYFIVVDGSFYFGDFIEALIVRNNWHLKELTISTLSLCENNIDSMANLLNGSYVDKLNLIVSDFFYSHERKNLIEYIYEELDKDDRFQLAVAGSHCKIAMLETHCGKHIVMHGSANLRSSSNIEQIVIEENKQLYDFNQDYMTRILDHYQTIDKSIRGKELWRKINKP